MKATSCHLCHSQDLDLILPLTPTSPANELVREPIEQECFPLDLYRCNQCQHHQLLEIVDQNRLYSDYKYVSSTSPVMRRHFRNYACDLVSNFDPAPNDLVVDIGSNDGAILSEFKKLGMRVLGVDPAQEIAKTATANGIETLCSFFTPEIAREIVGKHGKAKIITCNNAFAHTANLDLIVEGMKELITDDGVISIEVQYFPDMLQGTLFDMIYHEHAHYWTATSFASYAKKHELYVAGCRKVKTHGGSIRFYVSKDRSWVSNIALERHKEYNECKKSDADLSDYLGTFKYSIKKAKKQLNDCLRSLKKEGKSIIGYGAPAKLTTLAYHFGIDKNTISYIVDDSPWKQGFLSPGLHIPIVPTSQMYQEQPDAVVIFAWNFAENIIETARKNGFKGQFIIPLPELRIA